jgi:hypothetical protein
MLWQETLQKWHSSEECLQQQMNDSDIEKLDDHSMSDSYQSTTSDESSIEGGPEEINLTINFTCSDPWFIDLNKTTCKVYRVPANFNTDLLKHTLNINFGINDNLISL